MRYRNLNNKLGQIARVSNLPCNTFCKISRWFVKSLVLGVVLFSYHIHNALSLGYLDVSSYDMSNFAMAELCDELTTYAEGHNNGNGDITNDDISNSLYKLNKDDIIDITTQQVAVHGYKNSEDAEIYSGNFYNKNDGYKVSTNNVSDAAYFIKFKVFCATNDCYVYCYHSVYEPLTADTETENQSIDQQSNKIQNVAALAPDIYTEAEDNGLAASICKAIDIATQLMVPLFAIMFSIMGLRAFQGKLDLAAFFTFAIGMAAFKSAGVILEFFLPDMGLQYGCNCALVRYVRNSDGVVKSLSTGLDEECNHIG